jgi:iron complex outermembrane receptor protein
VQLARFDPTQPIYSAGSIYGGFFEYYNRANGELSAQSPRNPVAQLLQTFDKGINIFVTLKIINFISFLR